MSAEILRTASFVSSKPALDRATKTKTDSLPFWFTENSRVKEQAMDLQRTLLAPVTIATVASC